MAVEKKYELELTISYKDTEDKDRWMSSSRYTTSKTEGEDLKVDSIYINDTQHDDINALYDEICSILEDSKNKLEVKKQDVICVK